MSSGSSSVVYTDGPGADNVSPNLLTAKVLMEQAVKTVAAPAVSMTSRARRKRDAGSANVLSGYDETGRPGDARPSAGLTTAWRLLGAAFEDLVGAGDAVPQHARRCDR